ncbi:hypothetical protein GUITHDRAFT_149560 [Guillardia theta CCMP2712]|uniref:Uncharacterized protein n=1 Tax=Guillardia theta (strain CCMP2712) TaxID=905079 RepID=L1I570_GUITC|nr:hypothetical protein GUITHDRAFT_149560 [Guillardia theta CCMP2712]EKX31000.1 hypothetical protein GUITHDRAFT_149560 [Guillardia theta CCMP2712]|eukprot:XP_005817980.1 hypothetical protein GUITHDRAFT_149560 [Guillardia theta CCMP2712]
MEAVDVRSLLMLTAQLKLKDVDEVQVKLLALELCNSNNEGHQGGDEAILIQKRDNGDKCLHPGISGQSSHIIAGNGRMSSKLVKLPDDGACSLLSRTPQD